MQCDLPYEELAAFAAGDLEDDRAREDQIRRHVASCESCRRRLDVLAELHGALRGLRRLEPSAAAVLETRRLVRRETRAGETRGVDAPEIMTLEEAAEFLRITGEELGEILGRLPAFEIAGRVRVRRDKLVEWIERREMAYLRQSMESEFARMSAGGFGKGVA